MVADEPSLTEAVARMRADVAVVDLSLSPGRSGDLVTRLRRAFPDLKLVAVGFDDGGVARAALAAGADGFVRKSALATDLVPQVEAVLDPERRGGADREGRA